MKQIEMKIRFPDVGTAADLEVRTPLDMGSPEQIWDTLTRVGVRPHSPYSVHTAERVITSASVSESDGSRLSQHRAGQMLEALRVALCSNGSDSAQEGMRRSGRYPVARLEGRAA